MEFLKELFICIIDIINMKFKDFKEEIKKIYFFGEDNLNLIIFVVFFGFKYGIFVDVDLVFDVRFFLNFYYVEELRVKIGDDKEVRDYVMNFKISEEFYVKFLDMIYFLVF